MAPNQHDARADAAENWYWSLDIAKKFKSKYPDIKYRVIGAPFLYCLKNINYIHEESEFKKGSIVFPFHSTENIEIGFDYEEYCKMLIDLPDEYKPVTICIYHNDKKKQKDKIFIQHGFEVVCNGDNPCDDNFLYNFVKNVHGKKYLFTNEWSSAMHYASIMEIMVYLYGPSVSLIKSCDDNYQVDYSNKCWRPFKEEYRKYYLFPNGDEERQVVIANKELGMDSILSVRKMNFFLWKNVFTVKYMSTIFKEIIFYACNFIQIFSRSLRDND
ncbi:hypothetical protein LDFHOB_14050 [Candidatus Electronema aureum]